MNKIKYSSRQIDQIEERTWIEKYLKNRRSQLIETPIMSVKQKDLKKGQSMPDALYCANNAGRWLELTTFSRNDKMAQEIRKQWKNPALYKDQIFIPGISLGEFDPVSQSIAKAIIRKCRKNYSQCAQLAKVENFGTLLIMFVYSDPFYDLKWHESVLNQIRDMTVLFSYGIGKSCFDEIVFGAYVNEGMNGYKFDIIANKAEIEALRAREDRKKAFLESVNNQQP